MSEIEVIRLPEGYSNLARTAVQGSEKEEAFIQLVASGVNDAVTIAKKLEINPREAERALRDDILIGRIKAAIRAKAVTMMPKVLEGAYGDTEDKRARVRQLAREYIRKVAEGEPQTIQQNNQISTWDPTYDEKLYDKALNLVRAVAEVSIEDDGEGESH